MNKKVLRVIVPILIVLVIGGIYIFKNIEESKKVDDNINITSLNMDELKKQNLPIVLNFSSSTCPPCREMEPTIHNLAKEYQGKIIIKIINIDANVSGIEDFPIRVTPTIFFFDKNGKPYSPTQAPGVDLIKYTSKDTNEHLFTAREGILSEEEFRAIFKDLGVE